MIASSICRARQNRRVLRRGRRCRSAPNGVNIEGNSFIMSRSASATTLAEALSSLPKSVSVAMRSVSSVIAACASKASPGARRCDELACVALHNSRVLRKALAMKRRLDDAAHLTMERILTREQSFAKQQPQRAAAERFRKGALLRNQDVLDERRLVDEDVRTPW